MAEDEVGSSAGGGVASVDSDSFAEAKEAMAIWRPAGANGKVVILAMTVA